MHTQVKNQIIFLVPLFMAAEKAVKARCQVDDILEECGAAVKNNDDPRAVFSGLGNVFPPVFNQLKCGPTVEIIYEGAIVMDDLDINPEHKVVIRQRVMRLSVDNQNKATDAPH